MSHEQKGAPSTAKEWERTLIEDYRHYRWNQVMEPLCDKLQLWKDGQVGYEELDQFMERIHHQIWEVRNIFGQRKDRLVNLIQWWDREWFLQWIKKYAPPEGVVVIPEASENLGDPDAEYEL